MKSELICFIEGFLIVLSKGKEKKKDSFEGISECVGNEEATGDHDCMRDLALSLIRSTIHGNIMGSTDGNEEPNERAKTFYKLLTEAQRELYPGCKDATKVSFIVRIFQIKCMFGLSNNALEAISQLFSFLLPKGHCVLDTLEKVQKVVRDVGLDYQKIHACIDDCVLFWKEYADLDTCPTCGESRWKTSDIGEKEESSNDAAAPKRRVPQKILRYFLVTPRLQRLYIRASTSKYICWHKDGLVNDGKM
jgi:hypothetical protein